jgi:Ca2+-binding RTX toxin-like protein
MAITAATRTDIIELVVTALNQAPGTTLLNELVAIVDGGGTLADVATNLTTSDTWSATYPAFQTAEEFATEWLGNLVPEASAEALAEGIDVAVGLVNGGASFADIIIVAQDFLSNLSEDDASFGTSAANFSNKVEVATYYTITKEQAEPGTSTLSGVTSDDATVTTANAAVDTAAKPNGLTVALTTGLDSSVSGSAGDDTFTAVETAVTNPATDTFNAGDSITGGEGTDKLIVSTSGTVPGATTAGVVTTGVEQLSVFVNSDAAYTLDANLMTGLTDIYANGGVNSTTFSNVQSLPNLHLLSTNVDQTVTLAATTGIGSADSATVLSNNSAATGDVTATYNGLETINLALAGATGNATLGYELTVASSDLETVNVTGASSGNIIVSLAGNDGQTMVNTVDASAATGNNTVAVTRGAGSSKSAITMGSGDDHVIFSSATSELDTIVGGDGTDTLELSSDEDYSTTDATLQDDLSGVSGFEVLRLQTGVDIDGRNFTNNSGITKLIVEATGSIDYSEIVTVDHLAAGTATVDLTTDGSADSLAYNMNTATAAGITTTLAVTDYETINVASAGTTGTNTLTVSGATNDVTTVNVSGTQSTSLTVAGTSIATVDASGLTGLGESFTLSATASTAAMTVTPSGVTPAALADTANTITTGSGADTITGTAHEDNLSGGAGNDTIDGKGAPTGAVDTIDGGAGDDSLTGGSGKDSISDGAGNDTVSAGDGIDTITVGTGNDSIDGGAGNDTITGGENIGTSDTIAGGTGTDTLTMTLASVGQTPTISGVENIYTSFNTSTFLDAANITDLSTLRIEAGIAGAAVTVKNLATGATLSVTDDATLGGTAGNLTTVTVDTVADAAVTIKLDDNNNAATAAASSVTGITVTDAATLNITSTGGSSTNVLSHDVDGAISLDDTDTTALTITASAYGEIDVTGQNVTNSSNLTSFSATAATYGDVDLGTIADIEKVQTITLTASGESADVTVGAMGAGTASTAVQTISMTASSGGTISTAAITGSGSNMDSFTYSATGTNSTVTPGGAITTGNANINSVTISADDRGTVTAASGDLTVGSGIISAIDLDATNRGSVNLSGFVSNSTGSVAAGNWTFNTATRGTLTMDTNTSISTDGNLALLSVVVGEDSTLTGAGNAVIKAAGTVTDTVLTVSSDATTSGALTLGETDAIHTDGIVTLSADATNGATIDVVGLTFTALDIVLDGSSDITASYNPNSGSGKTEVTFDGTANALDVHNADTDESTITSLVVNLGSSSGTNSWDSTRASKLTYTGGSGADRVNGTAGADSVTGGAGDDVLYGTSRTETYLIATQAGDGTITITVNGVTNSYTATDADEDKSGAALVTAINGDYATTGGALASYAAGSDTLTVTYNTYFGTPGTAGGTDTTAAVTVTVTNEGTNAGNDTIDGGTGADTIQGGAGADTITLGSGGADDVVLLAGATNTGISTAASASSFAAATIANGDTMTFGNGVDVINGFTTGTDDFFVSTATVAFENTAPTTLIGATEADIAEDTIHSARGNYVASTGVFTFAADGADTLLAINDGTAADDALSTNTNIQILVGVTTLAAGDFI